MNRYEFQTTCLCPNGTLRDLYECSLESRRILQVEEIRQYAEDLQDKGLYQEQVADALRNQFMARVTVTGWHYNVKVICTRE